MNLDRYKTEIHLVNFAGLHGWVVDRSGGIGRSIQMRKPDGNAEIVVSQEASRWIYFRRDKSSSGTIIDFCQHELGLAWSEIFPELSDALKTPPPRAPIHAFSSPDRRISTVSAHPQSTGYREYLFERGIESETIEFFANSIAAGPGGAVQFPHILGGGEGHEYRGPMSKGFSPGGKKTYWLHQPAEASALVVCESGIDCLSYAQAHGLPQVAYASTGGGCSPEVVNELVRLAKTMGYSVIAATDADEAGERLAEQLAAAAIELSVAFSRDRPSTKDWNDSLAMTE